MVGGEGFEKRDDDIKGMSKTANCPSCGAAITFQSAISILAICHYCKSTLIRHDLELENIGKMAELLPEEYRGVYADLGRSDPSLVECSH